MPEKCSVCGKVAKYREEMFNSLICSDKCEKKLFDFYLLLQRTEPE